jgi:hypothetical protein
MALMWARPSRILLSRVFVLNGIKQPVHGIPVEGLERKGRPTFNVPLEIEILLNHRLRD